MRATGIVVEVLVVVEGTAILGLSETGQALAEPVL